MTEELRIVIVEDDALIAMDLADLLMAMGHDVCAIASTEADAVSAAIRWQPNFMIVDGSLAEGSGVSAMRQILARGFVPHLYVTGDPVADIAAGAECGGRGQAVHDASSGERHSQSTRFGYANTVVSASSRFRPCRVCAV